MRRRPAARLLRAALLLLALAAAPPPTRAAEWSKMKKCADLGFCRRHRGVAPPRPRPAYAVEAGSVGLSAWRGANALTGLLRADGGAEPPLAFAVTALADGMYRVVVEDAAAPLHPRHVVQDVLAAEAAPIALRAEQAVVREDRAEIASGGAGRPTLVVTYQPFKVELFAGDAGAGEVPLVSLNGRSLLLYETHRVKPSPPPSPSPSPSPTAPPSYPDAAETPADPESEDISASDMEDNFDDDIYEDNDDLENAEVRGAGGDVVGNDPDGLWAEQFQSHHDPKVRGPESVGADVSFPFASHLYGIPERTEKFALPHTLAKDGSVVSEPYRLYNLDVFEFELDKPLGLYGAVPLLIARGGARSAGMLWLNAAETYVDVLETDPGEGKASHWYSETGVVDAFLIPGPSPHDVFRQYRKLTGAPAMPQRFALGYHQCRWNYRDEADVRMVDGDFDKHEIPYDVLWLDIEHTLGKRYFTWDMAKFPDPTAMQNDLASRGRKMVTIIDPHVKRDKNYAVHQAAEDNKYYVTTPEGKSYDGWCWPGSSSYYDFTSPVAREAWAARFNPKDYPHFTQHLYTWVDMNEPSVFNGPEGTMPKHMLHAGGVEHRDVHNQYGFYVQQATHEGLLRGHGGNDRPFVLSRSFFAGSQRFGAVWTGDNTAAWDHLETSARMLLPLQITGIIFSGADVGGFFGNPSPELLVRWYQTGAFQPFFRGHAHLDTNRREPWLFGEENKAIIASAVRARYAYLPLWYTVMAAASLGETVPFENGGGAPPMRPLWWDFGDDDRVDELEDQWMVGSSLLVAPVMKEAATQRTVYLPGREPWYDLYSPEGLSSPSVSGGGDRVFETPLNRMLVFQRGGCIVPKQERRRRSSQAMATDPYTLVVALDRSGSAVGELYLDDGQSFDYKSGAFVLRQFTFADGTLLSSTVSGGDSAFNGSEAVVERVVVLGLTSKTPVTKASVVLESGSAVDVQVSYDATGGSAVIRRPDLPIGRGKWSITLS